MKIHARLRRGAALLALGTIALTAPAVHAQLQQGSFSLNEAAPGNEYLSVTNKTGLEGNSAYTIEAWVYPSSYDNFPTIVGNNYASSYWLGLNTSGRVRFYPRGGISGFVESTQIIPLNRWTHVAAVYQSVLGYGIFIDGTLVATGPFTGAVGTSLGDLRIGADREGVSPDYFWRGYLDDVRIWSMARTGTQIHDAMFIGVGNPARFASGAYAGLQAAWANEVTYPDFAVDYAGPVANDATYVNGDRDTHTTYGDPFGPPVAPNVGLALNGIDDHVVVPVTENFERGITVMAWIAPTDVSGFPTIVGRDYTTSFWLGLTSWGVLSFYPRGGAFVDGVTPIHVGDRWTHVAATYDGERTVLYVNGVADVISTDVSGPIGANGRDVWVGADNGASGLGYPFSGYLDGVVIVQGVLSREVIRDLTFTGLGDFVPSPNFYDIDGVLVTGFNVSFDSRQYQSAVLGSGARLVRAGTPAVNFGSRASNAAIERYAWNMGGGSTLPNDDLAVTVASNIDWPLSAPVVDTRVFISAPLADLSLTKIRLRSPSGTWVTLLNSSAAVGRDLLTVISDIEAGTWATGSSPYHDGVRPSEPLSGFNGENPQGPWRLEISTAGTGGVGLWAWALRVNLQSTDADVATPAAVTLRLAGSNPVRGSGILALELPESADVDLALLDIQGRDVLPLFAGRHAAGSYRVGFETGGLPAGVYLARLRVNGVDRASLKVSIVR